MNVSNFVDNWWFEFLDIDECNIDTDNCDDNAICMDNEGSFACACKPGYSGNGTQGYCLGKMILCM